MTVSEMLRAEVRRRVAAGESLLSIADAAEVNQATVWKWLNDPERDLRLESADKLLSLLGFKIVRVRKRKDAPRSR